MVWHRLLNGQEAHTLSSGDVLIFDGKHDIEGTFSNDNGGGNLGIQR